MALMRRRVDKGFASIMLATALAVAPLAMAGELEVSVGQGIEAYGALQQLDGYSELDSAKQRVVVPYKLSGAVRMKIAHNLVVLKGLVEQFEIARMKPGGQLKDSEELKKMLQQKEKLQLEPLGEGELGLSEGNPIPPSVLARLGPLLGVSK